MKRTLFIFLILFFAGTLAGIAEEESSSVEINGDRVQYSVTDSKVTATGHVVVKRGGVTLSCDRMEFDRSQNVGVAEGHVILVRDKGRLSGDKMIYNFTTMKGEFIDARMTSRPFYGAGKQVFKEGENHIILKDGYITTCDLDKPHFELRSKKIDIYPGDKAVAHNVTLVLGQIPVFWFPVYTQDLKHNQPMFIITPGYKKNWGSFVLTQWRHYWNDQVSTVLHVDERSRNGIGEGLDLNYNSPQLGSGFMRTYYIDDLHRDSKFFFDQNNSTQSTQERFKGEWRHKWNINENTNAIWQYYKLSDINFLKDFFQKEYEQDTNPPTYFLLTRSFSTAGTLSFRVDERVNRFVPAIDRMPEINYILPNRELFGSGFYWNNNSTYSNLAKLEPSPMVHRYETNRFDTDNKISYPFKLNIFQLSPYVGGEETFYSKTLEKNRDNTVRGIFKTGADVSTKFFKVYDVNTNWMDLNINRLRHVITPSVAYFYTHDPTLPNADLVQFDSVDSQVRSHGMTFSLENKLQTKRDGKSEDLLRLLMTSDFYLKEDTRKGGFNDVTSQLDLKPNKWVSIYSQAKYDTIHDHLSSRTLDFYLTEPSKKWSLSIGELYDRQVDDQITTAADYRLNPKWYVQVYNRYDVMHGNNKEQSLSFIRDLHEWEMKFSISHKDSDGDAFWVVFTLKEFPGIALDFGSGFDRIKAGAH